MTQHYLLLLPEPHFWGTYTEYYSLEVMHTLTVLMHVVLITDLLRKVKLSLTCRAHSSLPSATHTGHADLCQVVYPFTVNPVIWRPPPSVSQGPSSALMPSCCRILNFSFSFSAVSKSCSTGNQHVQIPLHLKNKLPFSPSSPLSFLSQPSIMRVECTLAISPSSLLNSLQAGTYPPIPIPNALHSLFCGLNRWTLFKKNLISFDTSDHSLLLETHIQTDLSCWSLYIRKTKIDKYSITPAIFSVPLSLFAYAVLFA